MLVYTTVQLLGMVLVFVLAFSGFHKALGKEVRVALGLVAVVIWVLLAPSSVVAPLVAFLAHH